MDSVQSWWDNNWATLWNNSDSGQLAWNAISGHLTQDQSVGITMASGGTKADAEAYASLSGATSLPAWLTNPDGTIASWVWLALAVLALFIVFVVVKELI